MSACHVPITAPSHLHTECKAYLCERDPLPTSLALRCHPLDGKSMTGAEEREIRHRVSYGTVSGLTVSLAKKKLCVALALRVGSVLTHCGLTVVTVHGNTWIKGGGDQPGAETGDKEVFIDVYCA